MTQTPEILTDEELYALEGEWEGMFGNDISAYINLKIRQKLLRDLTQPIAPRLFATIRALKAEVAELKKEIEELKNEIQDIGDHRK